MRKTLLIAGGLLVSFIAGFMYSNYHWNGGIGTLMSIPEQSSVELALAYMDAYLDGDTETAHNMIRHHALSDPSWNLRPELKGGYWMRATDFPSFGALEDMRVRHLEEVQLEQEAIRARLGDRDL